MGEASGHNELAFRANDHHFCAVDGGRLGAVHICIEMIAGQEEGGVAVGNFFLGGFICPHDHCSVVDQRERHIISVEVGAADGFIIGEGEDNPKLAHNIDNVIKGDRCDLFTHRRLLLQSRLLLLRGSPR